MKPGRQIRTNPPGCFKLDGATGALLAGSGLCSSRVAAGRPVVAKIACLCLGCACGLALAHPLDVLLSKVLED